MPFNVNLMHSAGIDPNRTFRTFLINRLPTFINRQKLDCFAFTGSQWHKTLLTKCPEKRYRTIAENQYNLAQKFANNRTLKTSIIKGVETNSTPKYRKNSPSGTRTCNPSVNSRMLCHWAIEEYFAISIAHVKQVHGNSI